MSDNRPIIKTDRLILRPWRASDAASLYEYASDPAVGPIAGWPPHRSVEESLSIIQNVLCGAECYAICEKGNDKAIGCIELRLNGHTDMTDRDDECELGYWLGKPFWGRGYMSEAANEILRHAFDDIGMTAVWCGYYDGNTRSRRVQEKLGFVYHHTCDNVPVPMMNEVRVGHTNVMTKESRMAGKTVGVSSFGQMPTAIAERLFALQDKEYRAFQIKLLPTVAPDTIIGVRTPVLRKLAKELAGTPQVEGFLRSLPHKYYEENNLHAFLIEQLRDYDTALAETERFLPYIDNWATCDGYSPKVFAKHKAELPVSIRRWLSSDSLYTVRYAIGMLMRYYLDEETFRSEYLEWVAGVRSEEYYLNMMRAWYFATALAKQPSATLPWLTEHRLDVRTHNKTIQRLLKAFEYLRK